MGDIHFLALGVICGNKGLPLVVGSGNNGLPTSVTKGFCSYGHYKQEMKIYMEERVI